MVDTSEYFSETSAEERTCVVNHKLTQNAGEVIKSTTSGKGTGAISSEHSRRTYENSVYRH